MADVAGVSRLTTTGAQGLAAPAPENTDQEPDGLNEGRAAERQTTAQLESGSVGGDTAPATTVVQTGQTSPNNQTGQDSQTTAVTDTTQPQDQVVLSSEGAAAAETVSNDNFVAATPENGTGNTNGATQALGQIIDVFV